MNLFDIGQLEIELKQLEDQTVQDGFWQQDSSETGKILSKIKQIKNKVVKYKKVKQDVINLQELTELANLESDEEVARDILKSTTKLEEDVEKLQLETLLSGK